MLRDQRQRRFKTNAAVKQVKEGMSIEKALEILLKEARASLKRTPELLPILKEVGVVDSGGTGLVRIIEGMHQYNRRRMSANGNFIPTETCLSMYFVFTQTLSVFFKITHEFVKITAIFLAI